MDSFKKLILAKGLARCGHFSTGILLLRMGPGAGGEGLGDKERASLFTLGELKLYQTQTNFFVINFILQYRSTISSPRTLKPSCPVTQFPTLRGRCHNSQGKEVLAYPCCVWNNPSTSKRWLIPSTCQPWTCFPPPTTLASYAVLGWRDLPSASPGLWNLAHSSPSMTRLPEVGFSAGWDMKVTTNLPDLWFKVYDSKPRNRAFTSAFSNSTKGNGIILFPYSY